MGLFGLIKALYSSAKVVTKEVGNAAEVLTEELEAFNYRMTESKPLRVAKQNVALGLLKIERYQLIVPNTCENTTRYLKNTLIVLESIEEILEYGISDSSGCQKDVLNFLDTSLGGDAKSVFSLHLQHKARLEDIEARNNIKSGELTVIHLVKEYVKSNQPVLEMDSAAKEREIYQLHQKVAAFCSKLNETYSFSLSTPVYVGTKPSSGFKFTKSKKASLLAVGNK